MRRLSTELAARLVLACGIAAALPAFAVEPAKGDRPTVATPAPQLDPQRFGPPPADEAFGAYQRGYYKTALEAALPRAEAGDAPAQTLVAELYARGLGVRENPAEAARWYGKAAEQGIADAQFQYALLLLDGKVVPKDASRGEELMRSAADAGVALAAFNYAQLLLKRETSDAGVARAIGYYEKAAEAGLPDAEYAMAQVYADGAAGRTVDETKARSLLEKAAKQGFDTAQLDLGSWMVAGRGGPVDYAAGFGWLKRAAESGNVAARNRLAKLIVQAIGTEPNPIDAAAWYMLARKAGLRDIEMEDYLEGLTEDELAKASTRADELGR